jgi:hypothetical protein
MKTPQTNRPDEWHGTGSKLTLERTRFGFYPLTSRWVPHISLVFREMWDTAGLPLKPVADSTTPYGCPTFAPAYVGRKRWAKPNHSL